MRSIWIPLTVSIAAIIGIFIAAENLETVFASILNSVLENKLHYSLLSFLILVSDIILPVPSSIVMFMNGFVMGKLMGSLLSIVSLLIGALVGYYIGKFTSYSLTAKAEDKANLLLEKYGFLAILITRGIPILSESICVVCGYNKMPLKQYFIYNFIGYFPVCLLYAICGSLGHDKNIFLISFGCSVFISLAFWLLGKKFLKLV